MQACTEGTICQQAGRTVADRRPLQNNPSRRETPPGEPWHPPCHGGLRGSPKQKIKPHAEGVEPGARGSAPGYL